MFRPFFLYHAQPSRVVVVFGFHIGPPNLSEQVRATSSKPPVDPALLQLASGMQSRASPLHCARPATARRESLKTETKNKKLKPDSFNNSKTFLTQPPPRPRRGVTATVP